MRFRARSVRSRVTLWNIAVLACVLAGFAAIVHFAVHMVLLAGVDRDLQDRADTMLAEDSLTGAGTFDRPLAAGAHKATQRHAELRQQIVLRKSSPHPDSSFSIASQASGDGRSQMMIVRVLGGPPGKHTVLVSDQRNRLMLPAGVGPSDVPLVTSRPGFATVHRKGHTWRTLVRNVTVSPGNARVVQVAFPLDEMIRLLHGLDIALLSLIPLVLVIAGAGGAFLTSRAFQPIEALAGAAAEIEASDLSRRLPQEGGDEMAHLARTFNGMLSRLDTAFAEMRQAMERQKRFTSDASHELRTPLTTVRAYAEWAIKRPRSEDEYREALQKIVASVDQMNGLIADLLELARAEAASESQEREIFDIAAVCREAASSASAVRGDIPYLCRFEAEPLLAVGCRRYCERILANLLDNAMRYSPEGAEVVIAGRQDAGFAVVTVQDSGPGIPADQLPYVCDRFYQGDASRAQTGAGLGLAICKSLVEAQQGGLKVESPPGCGARISFSLPARSDLRQAD